MSTLSNPGSGGPLSGFKGVSLAANIPGPVAAQLLRREGLSLVKVEPPAGDMLAGAAPALYRELTEGFQVQTLDLRRADGQARFQELLHGADLLITSQRPGALHRLEVTQENLAVLNPRLCWVEIVGDTEEPEVPGHDLTYQLQVGLVRPPQMPTTLLADLSGAQEAARAGLALLLGRERGGPERHRQVGLKQAAYALALPVRHGLTAPGGWLSGAQPEYRVYPLKDGWAGVAALEPHFAARLRDTLGERTAEAFLANLNVEECNRLANEKDLPVHAVRD